MPDLGFLRATQIRIVHPIPSKTLRPSLLIIAGGLSFVGAATALAQGCVAVRGGGFCMLPHDESGQEPWTVALGHRWLHSDRHFVGDVEQTQRKANGTEVINDSHFVDLGITFQFTSRVSATLTLPFVYSDRSSFYEHSGGSPATGAQRGHSEAGGIGDVRLSGNVWLWDPAKHPKGNIQFGLGLKLPTGDYKATDTFSTVRGPEEHYVDQSIQPGDGAVGFSAEFYAYREILKRTSVFAQGFYLFNPKDVNGVSTEIANPRGRTITALNRTIANPASTPAQVATAQSRLNAATALGYNNGYSLEDVMSVTDQYLARAGMTVTLVESWGLAVSLGGRIEGVPVEDALGDSDGFRRPGCSISIEPGITMMKGRFSASIYAPVALYRNRQASVADKRWDRIVGGGTTGGDAAFADFVINTSISYRF